MALFKALIVDDETQLRSHLRSQLKIVWPDLDICGEARSGGEAIDLVDRLKPDLVFLDINMPGLSGLDVAEKISHRCGIVFVTAYDEFAIDAFEKEAVDYLLKPVTIDRLEKTVKRIKNRVSHTPDHFSGIQSLMARLDALAEKGAGLPGLQWIKAQKGNDITLISVEDVLYFISRDKYTAVVTDDGESLIQTPIKDLAGNLDRNRFWQINRGVIVNVGCIGNVSRSMTGRYQLRLKNHPDVFTVSRNFSHLFKQM